MANSDEEGDRLASLLGNRKTMMMGNHGVLVVANTVAEAFDQLYYLERACQTLAIAYSTGQPLNIMSDAGRREDSARMGRIRRHGRSAFRRR